VRRSLGLSEEHVTVGTIARLFELKGHEDLLEIAPGLCGQFPNLRWLWIGDGILRTRFESQIAAMGLRDRFILTGLVAPEKIPELAGAMDVLVHPSRREGLARALPQAALAGKPVITYDTDGAKEGVLDGVSGFVLPPFDTAQLGVRIAQLANDPVMREQMGRAGREFAVKRFDATVMVDGLEAVYTDAVRDETTDEMSPLPSPSPGTPGEGGGEGPL
jgi:glycosyltransferase involved in cell wall biosynthesis